MSKNDYKKFTSNTYWSSLDMIIVCFSMTHKWKKLFFIHRNWVIKGWYAHVPQTLVFVHIALLLKSRTFIISYIGTRSITNFTDEDKILLFSFCKCDHHSKQCCRNNHLFYSDIKSAYFIAKVDVWCEIYSIVH